MATRIPRAVMTCSQWGVHPHEMRPEHEATGVAKMLLDVYPDGTRRPRASGEPLVEIFAMCQRCANEEFLNTGWPRYYRRDARFSWVQKPWKPGT